MIEVVGKIIQVGPSDGVALSKKDLARLGAKRGDALYLKVELAQGHDKHQKLIDEYDAFVSQYGQTLKNLTHE